MSDSIKVLFKHDAFETESYESAWVKVENDTYILDNILFYAKEYSCGDTISVIKVGDEYHVAGLIKESGHTTIRMLIEDVSKVGEIRNEIKELGCSSEGSNIDMLISVDVPSSVSYPKVLEYLDAGENNGLWGYEEACISSIHRNQTS